MLQLREAYQVRIVHSGGDRNKISEAFKAISLHIIALNCCRCFAGYVTLLDSKINGCICIVYIATLGSYHSH